MDTCQRTVRPILVPILASAAVLSAACSVQAETPQPPANPAHALAEKFAAAAEGAKTVAADRAAAVKKADAAAAEARHRASEAKRRADEAAKRADAQRRADEIDMLSRARTESEEREASARRAEAQAQSAEAEARRVTAEAESAALESRRASDVSAKDRAERQEADRITAEKAAAERAITENADEARKAQQAEREAETLRIVEKLRAARAAKAAEAERLEQEVKARAREATATKAASDPQGSPTASTPANSSSAISSASPEPAAVDGKSGVSGAGPSPVASVASDTAPAPSAAPVAQRATKEAAAPAAISPTRATVILVLNIGGTGLGRMGTSTADPVLCIGTTCYVGQGPDRPARAMSRGAALGPGNTLGARAGTCARSLECVFRDVEIGRDGVELQPVDLRLLRHDRRDTARGAIDMSCAVSAGRLVCGKPVVSATWRALIVPEAVAAAAGPAALSSAADDGLRSVTAASR